MADIHGFYYDRQKDHKLMSVSLHPNTYYSGESDEWVPYVANSEGVDGEGYRVRPLCRAILYEDFTVGVVNNWSDMNNGDPLGALFNSMKQYAPMTDLMSKAVSSWDPSSITDSSIVGKIDDTLDMGGKFRNFTQKAMTASKDFTLEGLDVASDYLNRALVTQGTRFSYYSGTGVSFGNLGMKFTIFADWVEQDNGSFRFKTVHDQLSELVPYSVGKYVPFWGEDKEANINKYLGWQKPPAGFKSNLEDIDVEQVGTLKMIFGGYYTINNLVVRDIQLTFSKQMIKNPDSDFSISPLYCEVILQLQPAAKYSDEALIKFIGGDSTAFLTSEISKDLENKYNNQVAKDNS